MAKTADEAAAEIREAVLKSRRRKQLIIGAASSILFVGLVATIVAFVAFTPSDDKATASPKGSLHASSKAIRMVCSSTDYEETCKDSLSKVNISNHPKPEELVKAVISVVSDGLRDAFSKTQIIRTNDSRIKEAVEDCRQLFIDSKGELQSSMNVFAGKGIEHLAGRANDMNAWLSAVMSYQQTCIDGFPDGKLKKALNEGMRRAKELTSNAMAVVARSAHFVSMLEDEGLIGRRRRLLSDEKKEEEGVIGDDVMPRWLHDEGRRALQESSDIKLTANVTVAKDGSGQFDTISAALDAMPKQRTGRYLCLQLCISRFDVILSTR